MGTVCSVVYLAVSMLMWLVLHIVNCQFHGFDTLHRLFSMAGAAVCGAIIGRAVVGAAQ